jgi:hypothetical protein
MTRKFFIKYFLFLVLLNSAYVYASVNIKIPCPPFDTIQQSAYKIDTAIPFDEAYVAVSSNPIFYENKRHWGINVFLNANSSKEAIKKGKKMVENISYGNQRYAYDPGNGQLKCNYGPGEVYAIVLDF